MWRPGAGLRWLSGLPLDRAAHDAREAWAGHKTRQGPDGLLTRTEGMIGTTIEHYQIVERLGQGGMGAVYRATDTLLEREVALKLLRPEYAADPQFAERFRAEAVMLAKLSHPNIATLFGFVRDSTQLCMVMELATGETLGNLLKRTGALSWDRAILLTGQMLDALQYAHERGVVHRDIKPSNLMVGQNDHLKLMDFGIARLMGTTRVTQLGFTVGTLEYMAPEQIRGEDVDGRADIYATGVVLYEMVTGQLPFKSSREQALMFAHLQQEVVPPRTYRPNLPWHLSDVIVRALSKAPGDRFATAREFSDALGASPSATTASIRVPNGQTVSGNAAAPRRRTSPSRAVTAAGVARVGADSDDETRIAPPPGVRTRGWFARWWPQVRVSSNRFGGAQEPGVMYQATVGAGGFGGAIRIVAVRMGTAGRKAASTVTQAFIGAGHLLIRRPAVIVLLLIGLAGGGWYWRQRQARVSGDAVAPKQASVLASPASAAAAPPAAAASAPATVPVSAPATVPVSAPAVAPAAASSAGASAVPPSETAPPPAVSTSPRPTVSTPPPAGLTPPRPAVSASAASVGSAPAAPASSSTPAATAASAPDAASLPAPSRLAARVPVKSPTAVESRASAAKSSAAVESGRTVSSVTREPVKSATVSAPATPEAEKAVAEKATIPTEPDVKLENGVTLLTPKDDDVEETDGQLILRGNEIVIIDDDEKVVRTVRLRADGPGRGPAATGPARIFSHRRTRWLVLPVGADQFVVQVDRDDVPKLTALLEARLGRPVTTVDGEPQFPKH